MFVKGNKFGTGRPKRSLSKPELLLPAILANANINWGGDFVRLYKTIKERALTEPERNLLAFFLQVLPYLCTKVQLKELGGLSKSSPTESVENARQTSVLLKALEAENSGPATKTAG
jgi:hypothetical protein